MPACLKELHVLKSSPDNTPLFLARILPSYLVFLQLHLLDIYFTSPLAFSISWLISSALGLCLSRFPLRFYLIAGISLLIPSSSYALVSLLASDHFLLTFEFFFLLNAPVISWCLFFSAQSRSAPALRFELATLTLLMTVFFASNPSHTIPLYQKPVMLSLLLFLFSSSIIIGFGISWFAEHRIERRERRLFYFLAVLVPLVFGLFTLRPLEKNASKQGGGLIQPNLFSFDFSPFIKLESEISMNDDLVMIVQIPDPIQKKLTRRFILSAYNPDSGFFMDPALDSLEHPAVLPGTPTSLDYTPTKLRSLARQTYYVINFDKQAFMAVNQAVYIEPYNTWNNASFTSVYRADSMTSDAWAFELEDSEYLDDVLPQAEHYIAYGNDTRIQNLASSITEGLGSTWERVQAINNYLREGEYRYSLKPGIAPDGNQLHYFLFDAKKGYCTYYAFSMTLLLRSIGIPARVAAGFILDDESAALSYYPVRANMAHAWVEVWFKGYGWIEFDPTSTNLAEGEEFSFSSDIDPDLFSRLIEEIQAYRDQLSMRNSDDSTHPDRAFATTLTRILQRVYQCRFLVLMTVYILAMLCIRLRFYIQYKISRTTREKILALLSHHLLRLRFAGIHRNRMESLHHYISRLPLPLKEAFLELVDMRDRVLFAENSVQDISPTRIDAVHKTLRVTLNTHTKILRRVLSWIAPPVLLIRSLSAILLSIILLAVPTNTQAQEVYEDSDSSTLLSKAREDIQAEFWDAAITTLNRGKNLFPQDPSFPIELGDLYSDKELYSLAWKEYRQAEELSPNDALLQYKLALTAGYLNMEPLSVSYFEKVIEAMPDDVDRHADLAWAYYKVHRARAGIRLLQEFESRNGESSAFYMTYGTLYTDEKDFPNAKKYYERSIQDSKRRRQQYIQSIAHYNYSLVLNEFHYFDEAFAETKRSIDAYDRPSGRLAKGEMLIRQGEYLEAKAEFQKAYEYDKSPLSKLALADIFQRSGDMDQAVKWIELVLNHEDQAWMYNYGTNINQHKSYLHSIAFYIYDGIYRESKYQIAYNPSSFFGKLKNTITYAVKARYHQLVYKQYAYNSAVEFESAGMNIDAMKNYYYTYDHHSSRGRRYLQSAAHLETVLIPQEAPVYQMEQALLAKDEEQIKISLEGLDPVWYRDLIIRAWTVLAKKDRESAIMLYSLHPGVLLPNGISLPVQISVSASDSRSNLLPRILMRTLAKEAGFHDYPLSRYALAIRLNTNTIDWALTDRFTNRELSSGSYEASNLAFKTLALAAQKIQADVFTLK